MYLDGYDLVNCRVYDGVLYTQAALNGQRTTVQSLRTHPLRAYLLQQLEQNYPRYTWRQVNDFDNVHHEIRVYKDNVLEYFPMSFLMRLNADFRHRVNTQLHHFYGKSHPKFSNSAECVAIHIRRDDRTKQGTICTYSNELNCEQLMIFRDGYSEVLLRVCSFTR